MTISTLLPKGATAAVTVTRSVGSVVDVMLSLPKKPLSLASSKSGVGKATGDVVSTVTVRTAPAALI